MALAIETVFSLLVNEREVEELQADDAPATLRFNNEGVDADVLILVVVDVDARVSIELLLDLE